MRKVKISDVFSPSNLNRIYEENIRDSGVTGLDNVLPSRLNAEEQIEIALRKFNARSYKFTNYKEQLFSKGVNKFPRCVSIATAKDRVILKALQEYLLKALPYCVTPLPQNIILEIQNSLKSNQFTHFIRTDIKAFYDNINHDILISQLSKKVNRKRIQDLVSNAISTPTTSQRQSRLALPNTLGVPQGLSVSNILAEIYLSNLDEAMKKISHISYCRYVDDILIICQLKDVNLIEELLTRNHKALKLEHHPIERNGHGKSVKGCLNEMSFDYLGYRIKNKKMSIRQESIIKFEAQIAKLFTEAKYRLTRSKNLKNDKEKILDLLQWKINLRITGCIFNEQRRGWVFYFSQIQDTSQLKTLDTTIEKFCTRFKLNDLIKLKSVHKAFFETKRSLASQKYIPNFDTFNIDQKRKFLELYLLYKNVASMKDQEIEERFKLSIKENIKDLERDLKDFS